MPKDVYSYESGYLKKIQCDILPGKEDFCIYVNIKGFNDADYKHAKGVCKDFQIKHLRKYHDLYVQSDILLLIDVFENFRNMCLEIY